MNILLLTHSCELSKGTNTGVLVTEELEERARLVVWERTRPDPWLLEQIEQGEAALLFPGENSQPLATAKPYQYYIVLDGTWQQARKIYNRSPYLHQLDKVAISASQPSRFRLRRNQVDGGLCTAESVIELLKGNNEQLSAERLQQRLAAFIAGQGRR